MTKLAMSGDGLSPKGNPLQNEHHGLPGLVQISPEESVNVRVSFCEANLQKRFGDVSDKSNWVFSKTKNYQEISNQTRSPKEFKENLETNLSIRPWGEEEGERGKEGLTQTLEKLVSSVQIVDVALIGWETKDLDTSHNLHCVGSHIGCVGGWNESCDIYWFRLQQSSGRRIAVLPR